MKRKNIIISYCLLLVLLFSTLSPVLANQEIKDMPTGWSKEYIESAIENNILQGNNGKIRAKDPITRAELVTIVSRVLGLKKEADLSNFKDVSPNKWYYKDMARGVEAGIIKGKSASKLAPSTPITREEAFTILSRVFILSDTDSQLNKYNDGDMVSDWAKSGINAMIKNSYIQGDNLSNLNPKDNITREEVAAIIYRMVDTYVSEDLEGKNIKGNVVINDSIAKIKDTSIDGDLIIAEGVDISELDLDSVVVKGRLILRSDSKINAFNKTHINSIKSLDKVIVNLDKDSEIVNLDDDKISIEKDEDIVTEDKEDQEDKEDKEEDKEEKPNPESPILPLPDPEENPEENPEEKPEEKPNHPETDEGKLIEEIEEILDKIEKNKDIKDIKKFLKLLDSLLDYNKKNEFKDRFIRMDEDYGKIIMIENCKKEILLYKDSYMFNLLKDDIDMITDEEIKNHYLKEYIEIRAVIFVKEAKDSFISENTIEGVDKRLKLSREAIEALDNDELKDELMIEQKKLEDEFDSLAKKVDEVLKLIEEVKESEKVLEEDKSEVISKINFIDYIGIRDQLKLDFQQILHFKEIEEALDTLESKEEILREELKEVKELISELRDYDKVDLYRIEHYYERLEAVLSKKIEKALDILESKEEVSREEIEEVEELILELRNYNIRHQYYDRLKSILTVEDKELMEEARSKVNELVEKSKNEGVSNAERDEVLDFLSKLRENEELRELEGMIHSIITIEDFEYIKYVELELEEFKAKAEESGVTEKEKEYLKDLISEIKLDERRWHFNRILEPIKTIEFIDNEKQVEYIRTRLDKILKEDISDEYIRATANYISQLRYYTSRNNLERELILVLDVKKFNEEFDRISKKDKILQTDIDKLNDMIDSIYDIGSDAWDIKEKLRQRVEELSNQVEN